MSQLPTATGLNLPQQQQKQPQEQPQILSQPQAQQQQQQQQQQQIASTNNNNNNNNPTTQMATQSTISATTNPTPVAMMMMGTQNNVIYIKYANVTSPLKEGEEDLEEGGQKEKQNEQKLNVFELHNEPLSVSIIESKFSSAIQVFDVSYNELSTLSKDLFCPLSSEVRKLNISHNLLENFDSLGLISQAGQLCLSELRVLDMSFNLIKHLPATGVATLHNLEVLNLSNNQLEHLDELSLSSLFKLIKLDLTHNKITQLPQRLFQKSNSMQTLRLQFNQITTPISQQLLQNLMSLEELNLSHNNISQVSEFAFVDKVNLTRVDLTHNQLQGLRQEALRVTLATNSKSNGHQTTYHQANQVASTLTAGAGHRHRLYHNGQYAGPAGSSNNNTSGSQGNIRASNVEFLLSSNPFVCDCNLEWLRKFQPPTGRRSIGSSQHLFSNNSPVLSSSSSSSSSATTTTNNHLQDQPQNDQPSPVILNGDSVNMSANSNNQTNGNSMSDLLAYSSANHRLSSPTGSSAAASTNHYGRVVDLEQVKCSPLFKRHQQQQQQRRHRQSAVAPSSGEHTINNHLHYGNSTAISSRHHHHKTHNDQQQIDLLTADASNFLCRYKSHCFALCHCCDFDACDCEMICPTGCSCYYDQTWQTNIIDCSNGNHTVVPDRIPMDVSGLYLDGNNIESLKPSNLIARKSLKVLYLNSTNLQHIANRTFNGLIELQSLYLNNNQLRTLNGYEFEPLIQLRALYLQSNRLDHIADSTFVNLRSLEILDLSNNRLTSSNLNLFNSIGHHNIRLRQLSIAHNWWSCQCNSINRFRQILKEKFLVNGSVNIQDKNQLRCYYNSTAYGPHILLEGSGLSSQPLQLNNNNSNRQQLTEINQCSDEIEEAVLSSNEANPPVIYAPPQVTSGAELSLSPSQMLPQDPQLTQNQQQQQYPQDPYYPTATNSLSQQQQDQQPNPLNPYNTNQIYNNDQPAFTLNGGNYFASGPQDHSHRPIGNQNIGGGAAPATMPLGSVVVLSISTLGLLALVVGLFVFVRQQQSRFSRRHKKSSHHHQHHSANSTSSRSSSSSSSGPIDHLGHHQATKHLGGVLHHDHRSPHLHQTLLSHHHHHQLPAAQQHHLIMGSNGGGGGATLGNNRHQFVGHLNLNSHHHHSQQNSASSQSNIYAALVSPTTGNSTIVTSATSNMNLASVGQSNNVNSNQLQNNNIYSNSSTTASHQSSNSQAGYWPQHQQSGVNMSHQYGSGGGVENPYAFGQQAVLTANSQQSTNYGKSNATINNNHHLHYGAQTNDHLAAIEEQRHQRKYEIEQQQADWIKLPKVKQFVSKLVNKSFNALSAGYMSSNSRDELSAMAAAAAATCDKIYDAFISYDKRDESFVMQHLSAELEYGQPQYRIADRYRDLPLPSSAYIAEAITSVIGCSHRTILVLTENYLQSEWCRFELRAALAEASMDKSHKIIAVLLDPKCLLELDGEMRSLLTNNSNISLYQQHQQLIQLHDGSSSPASAAAASQMEPAQLVATLAGSTSAAAGSQQQQQVVCSQTLATSRITFINYNERKFWQKIKQLMPIARPLAQTLTLTTKN